MLHLFFTCPFSQQVLNLAPFTSPVNWLDIDSPYHALINSTTLICLPPTGISSDLVSWLLWDLWKARNLLSFENRATQALSVMNISIVSVSEWFMAQGKISIKTPAIRTLEGQPVLPNILTTCNSDASWGKETQLWAWGGYGRFAKRTYHLRPVTSSICFLP